MTTAEFDRGMDLEALKLDTTEQLISYRDKLSVKRADMSSSLQEEKNCVDACDKYRLLDWWATKANDIEAELDRRRAWSTDV